MNFRLLIILRICLLVFFVALPAMGAGNLEAQFERRIVEKGVVTTQKGTLYYNDSTFAIALEVPVKQILWVEGNKIRIAYPGTKQQITVPVRNPVPFPFAHAILVQFLPNEFLRKAGLKLSQTHDGELWCPPDSSNVFSFLLKRAGDGALTSMRYLKQNGETHIEMSYDGRMVVDSIVCAKHISIRYLEDETKGEKISLLNVVVPESLTLNVRKYFY